jgi:hypothetical protein
MCGDSDPSGSGEDDAEADDSSADEPEPAARWWRREFDPWWRGLSATLQILEMVAVVTNHGALAVCARALVVVGDAVVGAGRR